MDIRDLIDRLRAFAKRHEPRSPERTLFLESAQRLEENEQRIAEAGSDSVTVEAVEKAMGASLLPWQRKRLEARDGQ